MHCGRISDQQQDVIVTAAAAAGNHIADQ